MGCDFPTRLQGLIGLCAFSILERIEWAATNGTASIPLPLNRFQYPRTDRMGCDQELTVLINALVILSVSSNGSNGLRPCTRLRVLPLLRPFSILERIEWAATG